jgi:hypothetical protein
LGVQMGGMLIPPSGDTPNALIRRRMP